MISKIEINKKAIEEIFELDKHCFPKDYTQMDDLIDQLDDERTLVFGIKEKHELIAILQSYNWKGLNDYIKIVNICVHPDYRCKGYAHEMLKQLISVSRKEDMHIFKAETRESNYIMQKIFESFGFRIEYKMEEYYDYPTETALRYIRE